MTLSPRTTLLAGAALILLVNAVALGGVYLNRSGEPESRLRLSERELGRPWDWRRGGENSGLALSLTWRVNEADAGEHYAGGSFGYSGGTPEWLDEPRMRALGFDTAPVAENQRGPPPLRAPAAARGAAGAGTGRAGLAAARRKGRGRTPRGTTRRRWPMPATRSSPTRPSARGSN